MVLIFFIKQAPLAIVQHNYYVHAPWYVRKPFAPLSIGENVDTSDYVRRINSQICVRIKSTRRIISWNLRTGISIAAEFLYTVFLVKKRFYFVSCVSSEYQTQISRTMHPKLLNLIDNGVL